MGTKTIMEVEKMSELKLLTLLQQSFDFWENAEFLTSQSIFDIYEAGFRNGVKEMHATCRPINLKEL